MNRPTKIPILRIRDASGNFISINAIRGENGKSAYEQAKEGGYSGTEEEFIAFLNGLIDINDQSALIVHLKDSENPHGVTASQIGAASSSHTHTPASIGAAASSHSHTKSQITDFPTSMTPTSHNQAASTITAGTLGGQVKANTLAMSSVGTAQVRDIYAGTSDMTAGSSPLVTGALYFVYE